MEASAAIQILPLSVKKGDSLSIVDTVIKHIEKSKLKYEVGPFETTVEGDLKSIISLIEEIQRVANEAGASETATYIKLFYKGEGDVLGIDEKVQKYRK
ncbi:MAG: thiamine-binding protein [Tissierellia bacterium]|nr:thiamine-binding protein [Tissierellia bacterium]